MQKSKINKWLDLGIKRFANQGFSGLNIDEMSKEVGSAKTSFYHFFGSKDEFFEQLLEYWQAEGTVRIMKEIMAFMDPVEAFHELTSQIINTNHIHERFLSQLRKYVDTNAKAKAFVEETMQLRITFLTGLYARAGLSPEHSQQRARAYMIYYLGLMEFYNLQEPGKSEKEKIYKEILASFSPENFTRNP